RISPSRQSYQVATDDGNPSGLTHAITAGFGMPRKRSMSSGISSGRVPRNLRHLEATGGRGVSGSGPRPHPPEKADHGRHELAPHEVRINQRAGGHRERERAEGGQRNEREGREAEAQRERGRGDGGRRAWRGEADRLAHRAL